MSHISFNTEGYSSLSWERWLIEKELQERSKKQKEYQQITAKKQLAEEEIRQKKLQMMKADKAYKAWNEDNKELVKKQQVLRQRKLEKARIKKEKESEIKLLKVRESCNEWSRKKNAEKIENEKKIKAEEIIKAENILKKQQMNKDAFEKWNESIKTRKRDPFCSHVYYLGELIVVGLRLTSLMRFAISCGSTK